MLQIRNDLEIVELLRKEPAHIREISKKLSLIPSTTMRLVRRLEEENVVEFKINGKNKTYQLRESLEANTYLKITEHYKLLKAMEKTSLRRIIKELQQNSNGELIVLFGSYAKNQERSKSDIDVYIETQKNKKEFTIISEKLSIKTGKLDKNGFLTKEIEKNHVIIQNVDRFYQALK